MAAKCPTLFAADSILMRRIPSDGQMVPVVGLGSWLTFDAPASDSSRRADCTEIIRAFLSAGGRMIDSSPMYGYSQDVIGQALRGLNRPSSLFSASKIWIPGADLGQQQMELGRKIWGIESFDLIHIHNMLDWESHLPWLLKWRDQEQVRYAGISTSHGRRHEAMAQVIREQDFDFVQFSYNIENLEAEKRLLPLAQEYGRAVVINRPFAGGSLFRRVRNRPLPDWAAEIDCENWAQFFLKFVVSHPAVTCAIPATSRIDHLLENMAVLSGRLPSAEMRTEMLRFFNASS
jgi:diketogulonate reductase-like aldo/keto reductase